MGTTRYLTVSENKNEEIAAEELSFLKRYPLRDESEFRVIYGSSARHLRTLDIPIHLASISKITLSPWLHYAPFVHVKRTLRMIKGCDSLEIVRSTLIENDEWKTLGEDARDPLDPS